MKEKRDAGLDLLKTLAMLCVCLYHFYWGRAISYEQALTPPGMALRALRALDSVCVPLFMMTSGALMLSRPFDARRHALRCLRLFVGAYVWYVVTQCLLHLSLHGLAYTRSNLPGIFKSALYLYEYGGVALDHLWFIPMLLAVYTVAPLIKAALDSGEKTARQGLLFFAAIVVALCMLTRDFEHVKPALGPLAKLDLSGLALFSPFGGMYGAMIVYFLLGGCLYRARARLSAVPAGRWALLFLAGWACLFAEGYIMTRSTHTVYDVVYNGYRCLPVLAMSASLFALAQRVDGEKLPAPVRVSLRLVGRNTLCIYYTHWIVGAALLSRVPVAQGSLLLNFFKAVLLLAAGTALGEGLRRVPLLRSLV